MHLIRFQYIHHDAFAILIMHSIERHTMYKVCVNEMQFSYEFYIAPSYAHHGTFVSSFHERALAEPCITFFSFAAFQSGTNFMSLWLCLWFCFKMAIVLHITTFHNTHDRFTSIEIFAIVKVKQICDVLNLLEPISGW